jgi:hypothetical protein
LWEERDLVRGFVATGHWQLSADRCCAPATTGVDMVMVDGAERYRELIGDLQAEPTRLRVADVVGVGRRAPADQTRLTGHEA